MAERPLRLAGWLDLGTRMTVVRLPCGGTFLHSPVAADATTRAAVDAVGPVRVIVAPNKVHHFFAGEWKRAYPAAKLIGAPGLPEKRRDLAFDDVLLDVPDPLWADVIDQVFVPGMPGMNETVFLHRPSRTLILTDLAMNVIDPQPLGLRFWCWLTGMRDFGPNRVVKLFTRDRAQVRAAIDRILALDFDRISVTHGDVLEHGGREALRKAFAWL